jgi:hypothetical protein
MKCGRLPEMRLSVICFIGGPGSQFDENIEIWAGSPHSGQRVVNFEADVALQPRGDCGWWLYGRNLKVPPARGGGELGSRSNSGAAPATVVE